MTSRYDELERLQRLRESGALTDEEFQLEKRRLLGHETIAPPEETVVVEPPAGSRRRLWIILGLAAFNRGQTPNSRSSDFRANDYADLMP